MSTHSMAIGDGRQLARSSSDDRAPDVRTAGLRELTRSAVHAALRADRHGVGLEAEVLPILRLACDVAHAERTMVEHLIIKLKEAWREQPEARPKRHSDAQDTLTQVISLCIDEYYAPRRSS